MALDFNNRSVFMFRANDYLTRLGYRLPIFHMASMARSGETLLLRTLGAHRNIHVVHNLQEHDSPDEEALFNFLKSYAKTSIPRFHKHVRGLKLQPNKVLLLKQSVWEHTHSFSGFVLARNPLSIFASLKYYDVPDGKNDWESYWPENHLRFKRWLTDIDPSLIPEMDQLTPVQQFCMFFNRRMGQLAETSLPIFHYEEFVKQPENCINSILKSLDLDRDKGLLHAHKRYEAGKKGHGKIDLSQPINTASIYKFRDLLTESECKEIMNSTELVYTRLGYELNEYRMRINGNLIT